jgi:hypothetical protein
MSLPNIFQFSKTNITAQFFVTIATAHLILNMFVRKDAET